MRWILCLPSPNTRFRRCVTFGVVVTELEIEKSIVVTFPADGSLLRWAAVAVEEGEMGLTRGFGEGEVGPTPAPWPVVDVESKEVTGKRTHKKQNWGYKGNQKRRACRIIEFGVVARK